jgi:hypothetical protein
MMNNSFMRTTNSLVWLVLAVAAVNTYGQSAQSFIKGKTIQANSFGTGTQMGRLVSIDVRVQETSTPDERQGLIEAFAAKGNEGLVNALSKMKSKGRISITGTLGYDIAFIREIHNKDGTLSVRLITNRPLRFGEVWADTRSGDYELSALILTFSKDKKGKWKGQGVLGPACLFKINKEKQLEIEYRTFPWDLKDVRIR